MSRRFHQLVVELAQCSMLHRQVGDEFVSPYPFVAARALTQDRAEALRKFMLFEQDQHRSLIEAIAQRNSARAEALPRTTPASIRGSLRSGEEGMRSMGWPPIPIRKQAEPVSAK